jgi:acyl-CoA thioesterase I
MRRLLLVLLLISSPAFADKFLFLGDSLTAGYGLAKHEAYPHLVGEALKKKGHNITVVNAGISGSTTASAVKRLRWHLRSDPKPKYMMLALGANDGLRGHKLASSEANLRKVIALAKKHNIKILLAGMKIPPNYGQDYTKRFEALFPMLAKEENIALIPFLLEGVAAVPKLNLPDGIHPNAEGQKKVAAHVTKFVLKLIESK